MKPIKSRDFRKLLKSMGSTQERVTGSHETWTLPNGRKLTIVAHDVDVSVGVLREIRKLFLESGYPDPTQRQQKAQKRQCTACGGDGFGTAMPYPCPACDGNGTVRVPAASQGSNEEGPATQGC